MLPLVRKEIRDALRHRWLQSYAILLSAVGLMAAHAAWSSAGGLGLQAFGRTTATLTNFCLLLAPLVSLTMGAAAIAGERDRGTLDTLLAQPLSRSEVVLGKFLGLSLSAVLATAIGFAPAAVAVTAAAGASGLARFLLFPMLAAVLVAAMMGVGILVSVGSRSAVQSQARAIFLWFLFVLLYDFLLMGTLLTVTLGPRLLVLLLILNPVDSARILAVLALEPDLHLLGPAGAYLMGELGGRGTAFLLLLTLLLWTVAPIGLALARFRLRPGVSLPHRWSKWTCERCTAPLRDWLSRRFSPAPPAARAVKATAARPRKDRRPSRSPRKSSPWVSTPTS